MSAAAYTAVAPTLVPVHLNHDDFAVGCWIPPPISTAAKEGKEEEEEEDVFDLLLSTNEKKNRVNILAEAMPPEPPKPYAHPFLQHSLSGLMSQSSLDMCTENLGSETGSDGFIAAGECDHYITSSSAKKKSFLYIHGEKEEWGVEAEAADMDMQGRKKLTSVNYHRSTCGRFPIQSFPPPLPSMSCRDGPCIQMRPHRRDGHLIVEAVAVPPHNYLHAERHGGRLRLCFVESFSKLHEEDDGEDQMDEDLVIESENVNDCEVEVEVRMKNRGTVVEFNVSMQPPPVITGSPKAKVRRSSLVINKFLVGPPQSFTSHEVAQKTASVGTTSAAAAAAVAAAIAECSISASALYGSRYDDGLRRYLPGEEMEWKLQFTSKRRSREELLHDVQRCSDLRWPLFIFEQPCCIATTT
ncbi:hypothetical protein KSP40_PGU008850 [Platanthera guangdongensis]|uniref:FAF domain-containing protein n=1 Tax=Platanthera guangdongensis TaxID=2320717 RepID=A0ABR2MS53_9ASPA